MKDVDIEMKDVDIEMKDVVIEDRRLIFTHNLLTSAAVCLTIWLGMLHVLYVYETDSNIHIAILVLGLVSTILLFGTLACLSMLHSGHWASSIT